MPKHVDVSGFKQLAEDVLSDVWTLNTDDEEVPITDDTTLAELRELLDDPSKISKRNRRGASEICSMLGDGMTLREPFGGGVPLTIAIDPDEFITDVSPIKFSALRVAQALAQGASSPGYLRRRIRNLRRLAAVITSYAECMEALNNEVKELLREQETSPQPLSERQLDKAVDKIKDRHLPRTIRDSWEHGIIE